MEIKLPNFIKESFNVIKDYLYTKWEAVKMKPEDSFEAQVSQQSNIEKPEMTDTLCSVDRISDLPDEVLIRILSLMSTKEAAPTFMLSKRWNSIWTSLPCLKFVYHESLFKDKDYSEFLSDDQLSEACDAKFIRFVDGVLRNRGTTPVDKFELNYNSRNMPPDHPAMEWFDHIVVNCKPQVLIIDIYIEEHKYYEIPSSVFNCASLEKMELWFSSDMTCVNLPEQVYLPSLKELWLCGAIFVANGFFEKLCSGSCLLEKLELCCSTGSTLKISSSLLKHLVLELTRDGRVDVEVNAPSLTYLRIVSYESTRIVLKNLRSLVDAQVHIPSKINNTSKVTDNLKNISALANATTLDLHLSSDAMKEILEKELFSFPTFVNLKKLVIGEWCMDSDFDLVAAFLEHSPNLQMLTLKHVSVMKNPHSPTHEMKRRSNRVEITRGALFLKEYLQTVVIEASSTGGVVIFPDNSIPILDEDDEDYEVKKESVDLLVKHLCACVRTIGETKIKISRQKSNYVD